MMITRTGIKYSKLRTLKSLDNCATKIITVYVSLHAMKQIKTQGKKPDAMMNVTSLDG